MRWLRRALLILGLGWLAFFVVYLVAANVILATHRLNQWVTGATKGLYLRVDSGWTIWPGRVHVHGVELHFEDHNIQFEVALDDGVVDLALLELPRKIFHLTRVRAEGVRYLFRHRVMSAKGLEPRLARYPKIAGYADPPLFEGPSTPPLPDKDYNLWTIELDDVDALAKELWFLEYRFVGRGRAKGGFRLKPERDARTDPCSLDLNGELRVGSAVVASKLIGRIEAELDRHDPRKVEGAQIFTKITFKTDLTALVPALDYTSIYGGPDSTQLRRGRGVVRSQTDLRHGAWQEHSLVHYQTEAIDVVRKPFVFAGPLVIRAEIIKGGRDAQLEVSSASPQLALEYADGSRPYAPPSAHDLLVTLGVRADLTQTIQVDSLEGHGRANIPELRFLNHALRERRFTGGSVLASASWRGPHDALSHGKLSLTLKDAGVTVADRTLLASGSAEAQASYDRGSHRGNIRSLELELGELAISNKGAWKQLPGGARVHGEAFRFREFPPRDLDGELKLESASLEPLLPLIVSSALLRGIATSIAHFGKTQATVGIVRTPRAFTLELKQMRSGSVTALGTLRKEEATPDPCGRFFIQDTHLSLGVSLYHGETSLQPFVSPKFWRERPPLTSCGPEGLPDESGDEAADPERPVSSAAKTIQK